ncbi:MAG: class I SAM-dependent methyltransferase [Gammaproteobacteria bacterium]|nr:class I SAM-dependent methyltransferase [Gammaproteobacteria bacterium]
MVDSDRLASDRSALASSYDLVPYDSQPFAEAHPNYLGALGVLHGLDCALPSDCRVLELGCASGGHLVPLAWFHPGSQFVGIDLSDSQVRVGRELVDALGLKNCTLHAGDLSDFDPGPEGFDYIIAHGLYSWVSAPVRDAILALCRRALRRGGVAYISYNALPGWRMRGLTRDLLDWHLRGIADPLQRFRHAKALIDRIGSAVDTDAPSSYLEMEVSRILGNPPSYLAHEYLEPDNQAFLLQEFVDDASRAGLRYLCNADLSTGFPELYGSVGAVLSDLADDPVGREQYLDFVASRAFRQSLLCRDDEAPTTLDPRHLLPLSLLADLLPAPKLDLRRAKPQTFSSRDGTGFEVCLPLCKAAVAELAACFSRAVPCADLLGRAAQRVVARGDARHADASDEALDEIFSLVVLQHVEPCLESRDSTVNPCGLPRAITLAQRQAGLGWSHLATATHRCVELDEFSRTLVGQLDGTRDAAGLARFMAEWLQVHAGHGFTVQEHMPKHVQSQVSRLLKLFARHGLLEQL